ncbi:alpha/beta hydrolase fold domain-containing protein [Subtercola sp. YIM 133946]|uniref:alpha/beta hydrolase fold domain-containing protein n=1 Tax=Subtercola sp. YIM 133946 TaxID=3118909 RepID=UPI002F9321B3
MVQNEVGNNEARPLAHPLDPELRAILDFYPPGLRATVTPDTIGPYREAIHARQPTLAELTASGTVEAEIRSIPGAHGSPDIRILILRKVGGSRRPRPCLYNIHGGATIAGDVLMRADSLSQSVVELDLVGISVEYRLAPEHPFPAGLEDCYSALVWISKHAAELGIDLSRIITQGASAGGGLAAATALLARDRGGPAISNQILQCPMLDDRTSIGQELAETEDLPWGHVSNATGWSALLGGSAGGPSAPDYAVPARAVNLTGLPTTYIDVGQADIYRGEVIAFADRLASSGVLVEFHLWPGAWHGFDYVAPYAALSQLSNDTRHAFLARAVGLTS